MGNSWQAFWASVLPAILGLARDLFTRHSGDAECAKAELAEIRNHGKRLDMAEARIDRRLDDLESNGE